MIRLKTGVRIGGLRPEVLLAISVAEAVWAKHGAAELVITSALDGKHMRGSEHYAGMAVDLRTHNLGTPDVRKAACDELRERLGLDYDVVLEGLNTASEHLHCEFDPKEPAGG